MIIIMEVSPSTFKVVKWGTLYQQERPLGEYIHRPTRRFKLFGMDVVIISPWNASSLLGTAFLETQKHVLLHES
jgi:hypothetical protein